MTGVLNKTCSVQRATLAEGTFSAASTETWAIVRSGVACALQPASLGERNQFGKDTAEALCRLYTISSGIRSADRVIVDGVTYDVVSPTADDGGRGHHEKTILRRRQET